MATPMTVAAAAGATQGRSFSFSTLAPSSHPSPRPPLNPRRLVLSSVLRFPTKSTSWSDLGLRVPARIPRRRPVAACLKSSPSFGLPREDDATVDSSAANASSPSSTEATFDMKMPRRNLLVQFTCNSCGEKTERIINRVAYERGTVFVQCAGCLVHHKLIDNLNLVVEYDLRNVTDTRLDATRNDRDTP